MYLLRLDDASEYMDAEKWKRMEGLLDKYNVKPIFGIIPQNQDPDLIAFGKVDDYWKWIQMWIAKGWTPALHGFTHVFESDEGGLNPVNNRSEFAGVSLERQCEKIREGYMLLGEHGIAPDIFFAPAHTFDSNTLKALENETAIRVISDTVAGNVYYRKPFYYIPQQSGVVRKLPFKIVTFCYHPNIMTEAQFQELEKFLEENHAQFGCYNKELLKKRRKSLIDQMLSYLYFMRR